MSQLYRYYKFNLPTGKLKTLTVRTNYPEEVRFVKFTTFIRNPYCTGVAYDIDIYQIDEASLLIHEQII